MQFLFCKNRIFTICIALSALVHIFLLFPLGKLGRYHFAKPVNPLQAVMVDLGQPTAIKAVPPAAVRKGTPSVKETKSDSVHKKIENGIATAASQQQNVSVPKNTPAPTKEDLLPTQVKTPEAPPAPPAQAAEPAENSSLPAKKQSASKKVDLLKAVQPPLRSVGQFLGTKREQLNYRISLYGMPIGTAELEAKNEGGELRINVKVKSGPAISSIYPVDDVIETRHVAGNFIISKIRQQEGSFKSNRGFTIMLRDKKVFWIDLLRNASLNETIPNDQVLDLVSAFYFLRNQTLEVGKTQFLDVYDSDAYSLVPVEILRKEHIMLPGLRQADTTVVKPQMKAGGIFKTTGGMTMWLTDDEYKVPVRMETSIPLGSITVELVSSEVEQLEPTSRHPSSKTSSLPQSDHH